MTKSPPTQRDEKQSDRFIESARELEADEDEARFKANLAQIARVVSKDEPVKPKKAEGGRNDKR